MNRRRTKSETEAIEIISYPETQPIGRQSCQLWRLVESTQTVSAQHSSRCISGGTVRRPAEPHARKSERQPSSEERQGRRRVDAGTEPVLVCQPCGAGEAGVRPDGRRERSLGARCGSVRLLIIRAGCRLRSSAGPADACSQQENRFTLEYRPALDVRRQRQRQDYLRGSAGPRHCAGSQ